MPSFYITSDAGLREIIELAYEKKVVAIDTEFTRETTYYPILSLVQIAVGKKAFVIDCLAGLDLAPIYKIIADSSIKKILYSAAQDLQILYHESNILPQNVFDVQLMANFCGFGFNVGYSNMVENIMAVKVDKSLQRSDWQQRPLGRNQIEYAMLDVVYLEEMYLKLCEILQENKREKWFEEEMKYFAEKSLVKDSEVLFKNFSMQKKYGHKNSEQITKIRHLILWREKVAQMVNVPRQHLLRDEALEEMVMLKNFQHDIDEEILVEAREIVEGQALEVQQIIGEEHKSIMNEKEKAHYLRAKQLIERVAKEENLREQFLIPSAALKNIILGNKKIDDLISGWRYFLFGRKLQKLLDSL